MISELKWEDLFNYCRFRQNGEYGFHRHYLGENDYTRITISLDHQLRVKNPTVFKESDPVIVSGITAFFIYDNGTDECLKLELGRPIYKSTEHYTRYYEFLLKREYIKNDKLPHPESLERVEKKFIPIHIEEESIKLEQSEKFFEECKSIEDEEINRRLKDYANGYIQWLMKYDKNFDALVPGTKKFILEALSLIHI